MEDKDIDGERSAIMWSLNVSAIDQVGPGQSGDLRTQRGSITLMPGNDPSVCSITYLPSDVFVGEKLNQDRVSVQCRHCDSGFWCP